MSYSTSVSRRTKLKDVTATSLAEISFILRNSVSLHARYWYIRSVPLRNTIPIIERTIRRNEIVKRRLFIRSSCKIPTLSCFRKGMLQQQTTAETIRRIPLQRVVILAQAPHVVTHPVVLDQRHVQTVMVNSSLSTSTISTPFFSSPALPNRADGRFPWHRSATASINA